MENCWFITDIQEQNTTDGIKGILMQQSKFLNEHTNGAVKGKFGAIKNVSAIAKMVEITAAISRTTLKETLIDGSLENHEDTVNLVDANCLYSEKVYGYEIYSNKYKYRIFEIHFTPVYPVRIKVDGDILEDASKALVGMASDFDSEREMFVVSSEEQLIDILKVIFSNRKVTYIISRMKALAIKDQQLISDKEK